MDEKILPTEKSVVATSGGARYELTYSPRKDIRGDYSVQVRYGLMSGLDPSRALIFSLQALGADLISRDFVMRELPWSMNVGGEQQSIDVQKMRDNLNASMAALAQAIPQLSAQGQDPSSLVMNIAEVIKERQKGTQIEDAVKKVFAPEPAPTMVLKSNGTNLTAERISSLLTAWKTARQSRSTAFLNADVELQQFGFDPKSMQLAEARQYVALELARACGIPAYFLSAETTSMTYSNAVSERRSLVDLIPASLYGNEGLRIYVSQKIAKLYVRALGGFGASGLGANRG